MRRFTVLLAAMLLASCGTNGDGTLPGPGQTNQINVYTATGSTLVSSAAAPSALHFAGGVSRESFTVQEHNYTGAFSIVSYKGCILPENGTTAPTGSAASDGTTTYTTTVPANGTFTFNTSPSCVPNGQLAAVTVADSLGNLVKAYFSLSGASQTQSSGLTLTTKGGAAVVSSATAPSVLHFAAGISNESFTLKEQGYSGTYTIVAYKGCILPENGTTPPTVSAAPDGTTTYTTTIPVNGDFAFRMSPSCVPSGQVESVTVADTSGNLVKAYFSLSGSAQTNAMKLTTTGGAAVVSSPRVPTPLPFTSGISNQSFTVQERDYSGIFTIITYEGCILPENGITPPTSTNAPDGTITYTTTIPVNGDFTFHTSPGCALNGQVVVATIADSLGNLIVEYFSVQ